jgi:Protein of unknown function (DUF732)
MRLCKQLCALASIAAASVALAASAHADVDTDFANQLHGYGIYGQRDYNAWLAKITCERLGNGLDSTAEKSAEFLSHNLPRGTNTAQTWQFLAAAIGTYCPEQMPILGPIGGQNQ